MPKKRNYLHKRKMRVKKKQSMRSRYHEHSGEERSILGYHKPKNAHKAFEKFKRKKSDGKVEKVMREFKEGALHSGSKKGPQVKSRKQAVAIALSEARKAGEPVKARRSKKKNK